MSNHNPVSAFGRHALSPHDQYSDRNAAGRFVAGNPGRPPGTREISLLRAKIQRLVVSHFVRNPDRVMDGLLEQNATNYMAVVMQGANEADMRAVLDLDPGASDPIDLEALTREGDQERAEKAQRKIARRARRQAMLDELDAPLLEEWEFEEENLENSEE